MKNLLVVSVVFLSMGMAAGQDRGPQGDVRARFAGAWRLTSLQQPGADGNLRTIDCSGIFVFTPDGHLSVQVMDHNPRTQTPGGPEQYSQGGYEASWGTYKVDQRAHTFTFHVEGALVRALVGQDLPRAYQFSGKQLIVKSTRLDEHWKVAWERY